MSGLDIPSYDEALTSRSRNGTGDGSSEERAGLLGQFPRSNYRRPTVEDVRSSEDSILRPTVRPRRRSSEESLHRELQQFEIIDPPTDPRPSSSRRAYQHLQKRLSTFASSVSSSLPRLRFPRGWPTCRWPAIPSLPCTKYLEFLIPYYRLLVVAFVIIIIYFLLASDLFNFRGRTFLGQVFDPATVQTYAFNEVDKSNIQHYLEYVTGFGHMAGTEGDQMVAKYIEGEFRSFGFDAVDKEEYEVFLNYPKNDGRRVAIVEPKNLAWEASLEEPQPPGMKQPPHIFHGYAKSGDVTGRLMYAHYGRPEDYAALQKKGANFTGAIVLVRQFGAIPDTGVLVHNAESAGAIGCLLASGHWDLPPGEQPGRGNMVTRGSVALMSQMLGDVLTPGYASTQSAARVSKNGNPGLVNIPSLPISQNVAIHLMKNLEGFGAQLEQTKGMPPLWSGNLSSPVVRLENQLVEKDKQRISNVLGLVRGMEQPDRQIIIGNHRDAWCWGASSPNSGSAILLEVARIFGKMMAYGWRPLRTIVFASWDGGEYNRIGSTEWVEDHVDDLRRNGMAYINLGAAVSGTVFRASGSPPLESVLVKVLNRVNHPVQQTPLSDIWLQQKQTLSGLGAGGDYAPFQHFAGISSIDIGFTGTEKGVPEWIPPNSCEDTYDFMAKKDPDFEYHHVVAQVVSLLALELADASNMPFNMTHYAAQTLSWFTSLESYVQSLPKDDKHKLDLSALRTSVSQMQTNMAKFDAKIEEWTASEDEVKFLEFDGAVGNAKRISHNSRMANFEHHLLETGEEGGVYAKGRGGKGWFKHILVAPNIHNAYETTYFPAIRDALDAGDWEAAQSNVEKVAKRLSAATDKILN
ncbi:hypothetical protein BDZ91DRAFT_777420 [Kalaharituber pfeilii]|nr:hypothetical protein BDZ91DRAFT_777420 [Kalaharituber pfeilii]